MVILRDPYSDIINAIPLLMSGGSTRDVGTLPRKEVGAGHLLSVPALNYVDPPPSNSAVNDNGTLANSPIIQQGGGEGVHLVTLNPKL